MLSKQRLNERIKSWERHAQIQWDNFQATGEGVYQSRARKYDEYAEIARMAAREFDDYSESSMYAGMLRLYKGWAQNVLQTINLGNLDENAIRVLLEDLSRCKI